MRKVAPGIHTMFSYGAGRGALPLSLIISIPFSTFSEFAGGVISTLQTKLFGIVL
jgi:hypothetical protein